MSPLKLVNAAGMLNDVNDNFDLLEGSLAGEVYYVDSNAGLDTNSGSSWEAAFKTLAHALAVSHANIAAGASGWAARNRIYVKADQTADSEGESLTKLAQKTDVIGVGSCNLETFARIIGVHAIDTTVYPGCRFINMGFRAPAAGGDLFTIPTQQSGISFINCDFDGGSTTPASGAIIATAVESLKIQGCRFRGKFSDAVIEIGAGASNNLQITDNLIEGADEGISINSSATCATRGGWILRNNISTTKEGINDASGKFWVHDNNVCTGNAKGVAGAGAIVAGAKMMLNNHVSCSDVANAVVPANGSL